MVLTMLSYISVGFVVACFESKGNAKAFVCGTSKKWFHAFLFVFKRF